MLSPQVLEKFYHTFTNNLSHYLPDGIVEVTHDFLKEHHINPDLIVTENEQPKSYYVLETEEKITLLNENFVIWIIPTVNREVPVTFALIASIYDAELKLELCFSAADGLNAPHIVLKVLDYYVDEIEETNSIVNSIANH